MEPNQPNDDRYSASPISLPRIEEISHRLGVHNNPSNDGWCVQTFLQLRHRGLDVRLVSEYIPGQICVTSYEHLTIRDFPFQSYVVVCQHDRGRPEICEQRIVQNQLNILSSKDHWLPYWPQPGLIERKNSRGHRIENMAFKGRRLNLAYPFRESAFLEQLKELDINIRFSPDSGEEARQDWMDYSDVDVVLAISNATQYNLSIKPASKLVNAWIAGCPALLGPEPAFQALRCSELDYIEIRSPQEAMTALKNLKENPKLFTAMIDNGKNRAKDFHPDSIAQMWRDLLAGPIATGYEQWQHPSIWTRVLGRPLQFAARAVAHRHNKQYFHKHIQQGLRLFPQQDG